MSGDKKQGDYGKQIKRAANLMARSMDAYARGYGLTGSQMSIIDFLGDGRNHTQRDIEAEFDIRGSTATVILRRMEAKGLVVTRRSPDDGRQKTVCLAEGSKPIRAAAGAYIQAQREAMTDSFSRQELDTFLRVLSYFIHLNSQQGGKGRQGTEATQRHSVVSGNDNEEREGR